MSKQKILQSSNRPNWRACLNCIKGTSSNRSFLKKTWNHPPDRQSALNTEQVWGAQSQLNKNTHQVRTFLLSHFLPSHSCLRGCDKTPWWLRWGEGLKHQTGRERRIKALSTDPLLDTGPERAQKKIGLQAKFGILINFMIRYVW